MDIINRFTQGEPAVSVQVTKAYAQGPACPIDYLVVTEHALDVYLNEVLTMRIVCTPSNLVELVVGRLFSEGIIDSVDDIESVYVCEYGTRARIMLRNKEADFSRCHTEVVPTCCTGNRTFNGYFTGGVTLREVTPIPWEESWLFAAAQLFARDTPLHKSTFGTHSCYLIYEGEVLFACEDLGRHNAFDKVIGRALLAGVDLKRSILFSSGRIPEDMMIKAIRAQVPVLVTKAVPTDAALNLAERYNVTFVSSAHPDSMVICHDPWDAQTPKFRAC
jgi:FdhD protein